MLDGIELKNAEGLLNPLALNNRLRSKTLPVILCQGISHPLQLKGRLRLPMMFQLHKFESLDNQTGVIAFGREALLLHTLLKRRTIDCGGGAFFC